MGQRQLSALLLVLPCFLLAACEDEGANPGPADVPTLPHDGGVDVPTQDASRDLDGSLADSAVNSDAPGMEATPGSDGSSADASPVVDMPNGCGRASSGLKVVSGYTHLESFPVDVSMDSRSYVDDYLLPWTAVNAQHSFLPTGGWNGCGAARFVPPSTGEGMAGLGQVLGIRDVTSTSFLAIRYCIKAGPTFAEHSHGAKPIILFRADPSGSSDIHDFGSRPMVISRPDPQGRGIVYGLCDGTVCTYVGGDYWPDGSDTFWLSASSGWACLEFDFDLANDQMRMYVSTQDGRFDDTLYLTATFRDTNSGPGGIFTGIDTVGGYFAAAQADPGNYYDIDDLALHTAHIGPPAAFVQP